MHHRMPKQFSEELGQRVRHVISFTSVPPSPLLTGLVVKWLGVEAPGALAVDGKGGKADLLEKVARWVAASGRNVTQPVMIVSYETLRTLQEHLANCHIGLLLCDEGHRLKNSGA